MPINAAHWSVDEATKNVRYIGPAHGGGGPSYATVIEFHRWLSDLADDATFVGNDELDITKTTPSERSTDNIITLINSYNIDDPTSEHLYDGSIIQANGAVIYDGIVNYGNTSFINVMQNGGIVANDFWNTYTPAGFNADTGQGISHRFLVKVRTASADIDGRRLLGMSRQFNKSWSEFPIAGTSRGNNVLALSESDDLNNATIAATVAGWNDIVNDLQGYVGIDADGNAANEFYYSNWELGSRSKNQFYERTKWLARVGTGSTLYGLGGEIFRGITHEINIDTPTGVFVQPEALSWAGGTGQLLAINSVAAGTKLWIQLLTGVAPTDNQVITGGTSAASCMVNVTVVARPISVPFVGSSTGSAIIGAYGLGIGADDLASTDKVTDLTAVVRTPPNNVTFTVAGLVVGEDRVLVGPELAGVMDEGQFGLNATLNTDNVASIVVDAAIPTDTPASGTIRVKDNNGLFRRLAYSSWAGSTFTISSVDGNEDFAAVNATAANDVFISYIDKLAAATSEAFTGVYFADRSLFIRVRDGAGTPIKTFETTGTLGAGGGSTTVIRTSDQ
jgi:hypothetical protein